MLELIVCNKESGERMNSAAAISIVSDVGSGRPSVLLVENEEYANFADVIASKLQARCRVIVLSSPEVLPENYELITAEIFQVLSNLDVRHGQFVGLGSAAALVQNLALHNPRLVRSMVIVDASMRPHPTRAERVLDRLERGLPFGLPLRLTPIGFNVRAFAHRLRCPILLIASKYSNAFVRRELRELSYKAPTAWYMDISEANEQAKEVVSLIDAFQGIPAKSPQKNLQVAL